MEKRTLRALNSAIKKWEGIVAKEEIDLGQLNCQLCELFADKDCKGCPVNDATKHKGCANTPYQKWLNHHEKAHKQYNCLVIQCKICERYAKQEVAFLKSLRPK